MISRCNSIKIYIKNKNIPSGTTQKITRVKKKTKKTVETKEVCEGIDNVLQFNLLT